MFYVRQRFSVLALGSAAALLGDGLVSSQATQVATPAHSIRVTQQPAVLSAANEEFADLTDPQANLAEPIPLSNEVEEVLGNDNVNPEAPPSDSMEPLATNRLRLCSDVDVGPPQPVPADASFGGNT